MSSAPLPLPSVRAIVLAIARLVPSGRIVSYGDIAELVGIGPRQVGRIISTHGEDDIPWWRVTNTHGDLPLHLHDEALARYREEGTAIKRSGRGAAIRTHRADLPALADDAESALGPLAGAAGAAGPR
ncbi:MAG: MGMT family protein [Micrococcales bacterium]|nr:MGMT family protein [Micrococcales bacterium]